MFQPLPTHRLLLRQYNISTLILTSLVFIIFSPNILLSQNLLTAAVEIKAQSTFPNSGDFFPARNEFSTHSVIRPQIYHGRYKKALHSTLDAEDGLHASHITLSYNHQGRRVYIDLKRNDELLPDEHFLKYQNSRATPNSLSVDYIVKNFTKTELDLCHYQGSIRDNPKSNAAISTCNGGINGLVFDGIDTYFIHSGSDGRLQDDHFLFRHADLLNKNSTCGYDNDHDNHDNHKLTNYNNLEKPDYQIDINEHSNENYKYGRILKRHKRSYDETNRIRGPYNANKYSSYVELVIVVDNKVFKAFGENSKKVHQHCKDLANIINALYVPLNIFVALIGVVIWNESNEIEFSSDGDVTLRNFLNYRRTKLVLEHPNDNAQLLTKEQFTGGVVGKALKGPICTHEYSGGVSMEHSQIIAVVATTMAHEMGHNFGMEHDSPDCKCRDEKCIMSASSTSVVPVHWSSCSIDQLNIAFARGMNYCLRNKPNRLFESPQCGNGFVEPGEQCDCGLPNYCENTCCDPYTCMLHTNASCATGECCDLNTCRPKMAGTACRIAENECDLPEYCTGESEYCPIDVFKRDTEECGNNQAYCFQGSCRSHTNQCRILWGSTGESSEHCYYKNAEGKRGGNCGYNRLNNTFIPCETENVACGMLHCRHLNERLEFGMESAAVLSHSFINHGGNIVPCRTALVDLGLQSTDPGLTPNGAKCGDNKMCVNQKCLEVERVRAMGMGKICPDNCNDNGICNSRGNCHCNIGYAGETCLKPGSGGSIDSGPATNPNSHEAFQRFMYIFFFLVIPLVAAFCIITYYCRNHPFFIGGKLAENIIKTASGNKQTTQRPQPGSANGIHQANGSIGLQKSTPSSTDDMNSALLKSPSDSSDPNSGSGMFGKFKGFTLRPLGNSTPSNNQINAPNIAYVQPTVQDINTVPQRTAPPPPNEPLKPNGTLSRKAPPPPIDAPALPPPNPGSQARPIISMPVLETSTLTLPLKTVTTNGPTSPTRQAPAVPAHAVVLKSPPPPPVPLHSDPKLNIKRDGTIRRIASFLKKDDKPPAKEKTYIDRDKLRSLEISAPIPVGPLGESSNSESETITPKEEETQNLVKRAQSMRSPTKKPNVQTFGSMRQPSGTARPKSAVNSTIATRPKSPPPRPPPLLRKTNSTTSSGYQLPIATAKSIAENTYDDCEFVEVPLTSIGETNVESPTNNDNIYSVIDEIPPAAQTLKRADLINMRASVSSDMGLLGEIVNEIEKRNGDSIYTATNLTQKPDSNIKNDIKSNDDYITTPKPNNVVDITKISTNQGISNYLRPTTINTPVARVAPTRSDMSPTTAFSSFKPAPVVPTTSIVPTIAAKPTILATAPPKIKSFPINKTNSITNKTLPGGTTGPPSATIQKPKPLSIKPSFNKSDIGSNSSNINNNNNASASSKFGATNIRGVTPPVKSSNMSTLTQRFEKANTNKNAAKNTTTTSRK